MSDGGDPGDGRGFSVAWVAVGVQGGWKRVRLWLMARLPAHVSLHVTLLTTFSANFKKHLGKRCFRGRLAASVSVF